MNFHDKQKEHIESKNQIKNGDIHNNNNLKTYLNKIESHSHNNDYLGKKRISDKPTINDTLKPKSNNTETDKDNDGHYYNINKYQLIKNSSNHLNGKNENKNDSNKKMEYDYNYYLFKSKRVNYDQNQSYAKNDINTSRTHPESNHSSQKELSKPHYSSHGMNSGYKYPKYLGDYSYHERHLIGNGSFGKVFCGIHRYRRFRVAIKLPTEKSNSDMIDKEVQYTRKMADEPGFPMLFFSSVIDDKYVMIESLLGPSLDKLFIYCEKSFPMKTICLIGIDIVKRLRSMHKNGLLHRDLKPNNFAWGNYSKNYINMKHTTTNDYEINSIYLLDFGLSESYIDPLTGQCYKIEKGGKFIGTLRYSSVNSHKGVRQCRKDDLESLFYVLIYFYKGKLPWQDVKSKQKEEKHLKIKEEKMRISAESLCRDMPQEFVRMLCYVKNILYSEEPNYDRLIQGFEKIINSLTEWETIEMDYNYIWEKKLHDDLKKRMFSIDENANKKISEEFGLLFKGYPNEIKRFIEKTSINGTNKIKVNKK